MKKLNYFLAAMATVCLCACVDDDTTGGGQQSGEVDVDNPEIEALATTAKWNNYLVAATDELYNDCVRLWAAWAGPDALSADERAIVGDNFFGDPLNAPSGWAARVKNADGDEEYHSPKQAVEATIIDGAIDIAGEIGEQKIGGPYGYAQAGNLTQGVLEVESWYSWNSITDYSDNVVSIRSAYLGGYGATQPQTNSLAEYVNSADAALHTATLKAINDAYIAIRNMDAPFRNNLTGANVVAAIDACATLSEHYETALRPFLADKSNVDFKPILEKYADSIVVETYADLKARALVMRDRAKAYSENPTNESLAAVCAAWKSARVPWEQSEAFLFGPADILGLDPSLDSWPLDQQDILSILKDNSKTTVEQIRSAIGGEGVRGFHTIELLLFKNGKDRTIQE